MATQARNRRLNRSFRKRQRYNANEHIRHLVRDAAEAGAALTQEDDQTLSRQRLRAMLRTKAEQDILQQYGIMGKGHSILHNSVFVGYDSSFPRRTRRSVIKAIVKRWYVQVMANNDNKRPAPGVLDWFRDRLNIGARANTLKASGVGI